MSKKYVKVFVHESPSNELIVAAIIIQIFMHDNHRVVPQYFLNFDIIDIITAAWLAHEDERRTTVREVWVQDPGRTHTQGLKITEENVF